MDTEPEAQRCWNEYDHPEDEETGYYIYVDPNATMKFPRQELIEAWMRRTRKLLGMQDNAEQTSLTATEDDTNGDNNSLIESIAHNASYGTIFPHQTPPNQGFFSTLFRSLCDPPHHANILHERHSPLSDLEIHQDLTRTTKIFFYSICLATAIVIDVILGLVTVTRRKKRRGIVDGGVFLGMIFTLVVCILFVLSMWTRRGRLGWVHQGAIISIAAAVVALDVLLMLWISLT